MLLIALLALPFVGSLVAALLQANARNAEAWLAGAVALAGLALTASHYPEMSEGQVVRFSMEWLPGLGIDFSLRMDGFAWLFCVLLPSGGPVAARGARPGPLGESLALRAARSGQGSLRRESAPARRHWFARWRLFTWSSSLAR